MFHVSKLLLQTIHLSMLQPMYDYPSVNIKSLAKIRKNILDEVKRIT